MRTTTPSSSDRRNRTERDDAIPVRSDHHLAHEALNHYETLDGRDMTVWAVAWIDRDEDGPITSIRIYNDQNPLFATPDPG